MNQEYANAISTDAVFLGKKSWTAYISTALLCLLMLIMTLPFALKVNIGIFLALEAAILVWGVYNFLMLRSVKLYMDDTGVWVCRGILPWNKGVNGVKWRDLDEAVYFQKFFSWALRSYTIRISHRFTKSSEIILSKMDRGDKAVEKINSALVAQVRNGAFR